MPGFRKSRKKVVFTMLALCFAFVFLSLMQETNGPSLFVTHDVEEAVTLADRILVMGRSPGCIQADVPVAFPPHRD